ncbi:helicase-like transcription factor CHR28 isoform X1 [Elaeis guineensis]|uniref:Helicase-like transcription factor CHR28 isoform X1 n=2 Tax=Elaeis guineensis var. tenera TaxID=51953 RepID=A0A6I9QHT7_ELAGV|nr:helicase-like transcription factor CHR28 isoform X1 [Elaeis guineensis]
MLDHAYPLYDLFQTTCRWCSFLREWIFRPISIVLQSIPFHSHYYQQLGTSVSPSFTELIAEETSNYLLPHMDIIEIDSSESEDDLEIRPFGLQDRSYKNGASGQWRNTSERFIGQNHDSGLKLPSHSISNGGEGTSAPRSYMSSVEPTIISNENSGHSIRSSGRDEGRLVPHGGAGRVERDEARILPSERPIHIAELDIHAEPSPSTNFGSDAISTEWGMDANSLSQHSQRRILPSFSQRTNFKHASEPSIGSHIGPVLSSQQKELAPVGHYRRSEVNLNDIANDRRILNEDQTQNGPRRVLPSSLQPAMHGTASKSSLDYEGGSQIHNFPGTEHDSVRTNVSDGKVVDTARNNDEFHAYGINGKGRILPSSVLNGKSISNSQPKSLTEARDISNFQAKSSFSLGANIADGAQKFPSFSIGHEKSGTSTAKATNERWGKGDFHMESSSSVGASSAAGVQRVLPMAFMKEKNFNNTTLKTSTEYRDDGHTFGNAGNVRVLPSSLMHGKSINSFQSGGVSDAQNHLSIGEDRRIEHDERVIYQEALQNLGQPKLEDDLPEGLLAVSLLKHQKIALAWMIQKEKSVLCAGGILADDQGLGKTVSMIALIQKQMTQQSEFTSGDSSHIKSVALNLDEDDDGVTEVDKAKQIATDELKQEPVASTSMRASHKSRPAAGTLVVCPASVLRQWARELDEKVTNSAKLSVLVYHGGARTKNPSDLAKYDVVLTTYSIVTNEVPKQSTADDDDGEQRNLDRCGLMSEFSSNKKRKQTSNRQNKVKKKGKGLKDSHFDLGSGPLARVRWFRVVLDEAQTIKNHRTQVARACCGLRAKRRWCLSGTPMQNAIDDLYSYFRFLKYDPYAVYSSFCASIKYPISRNASQGYKKLQAVLRTVLLRRTKGTLIEGEPILKLPPKSISMKRVEFSTEERAFYLRLESDSRQQFKEYAAAGTVKQNYANILLMLLRLRQACDHPLLVKGYHSDTVGKDSLDMARQLPREMLINLLNQLEGSLAICGICSDPPEDPVVTMCGHVFCYQCVSDRLTGDDNLCPAAGCRDILGTDSVFSRATLRSCISDEFENGTSSRSSANDEESSITQSSYISSKIRAALDILNSVCKPKVGLELCSENGCYLAGTDNLITDGFGSGTNVVTHTSTQLNSNPEIPVKAIIFSQWTSMLDLLEFSLNQSLMQYRRLDGTMSLNSRDRAVKDFNTDPEVRVMLMSLKAGNLGLNMVAACHVILLDLWWNPTTEDQAVDRAHRIGQTRPVTVSRLTIKDTVEDRILALQEEKRKMVSSAFGEDQTGGHATRLTVEDLRYLFMG